MKFDDVGLAVISYNRPFSLACLLNSLQINNILDLVDVIVSDDSSPQQEAILQISKKYNCNTVISTPQNSGVAFSKNNALKYFYENNKQYFILIEDDMIVTSSLFIETWYSFIKYYDHINYIHPLNDQYYYDYDDTFVSNQKNIAGQVMGISKYLIDNIGYLSTDYSGYGFAHTDYTVRSILKLAKGGIIDKDNEVKNYLSIKGYAQPNEVESSNFNNKQFNKNKLTFLQKTSDYYKNIIPLVPYNHTYIELT